MSAEFKYIHHACFTVTKNGETLICDPFLDGNPKGVRLQDLKVNYIFITHAHGDHLGCANAGNRVYRAFLFQFQGADR